MSENPELQKAESFPAQRAIFGALALATLVLTLCTVGMERIPAWYGALALGVGAALTLLVLAGHAINGMLADIREEEALAAQPAAQTQTVPPRYEHGLAPKQS